MLALSVRQPWAWLIIHGHSQNKKDIENRTWPTKVRGRVLVHASRGMTRQEYDDVRGWLRRFNRPGVYSDMPYPLPLVSDLQRGGIIGSVEIVDCVMQSASPWFFGPFGFVLRDPVLLPFRACKGQLGFFEVTP
jgi:hypothetical protein